MSALFFIDESDAASHIPVLSRHLCIHALQDYSARPCASPLWGQRRKCFAAQNRSRRFCLTPRSSHTSTLLKTKTVPNGTVYVLAFEPPDPRGSMVFKTTAFDHSASSPEISAGLYSARCILRPRRIPYVPSGFQCQFNTLGG